MLRITVSKSASGATKYFDEGLTKSDYYQEKGEIIGQWHGKLAEQIGLKGDVKKEAFEALAYNKNPITGEQLTAKNIEGRRVGYDFTFSVPKSVSITYSQTRDKDILHAFNGAINETMSEIQEHAATRVRANGKNENRYTENLIWGTFTHEDARPVNGLPDPHLHQHVFVFNATHDQKEQRFKAAQFGEIKSNAPYFETAFHARLANNLQEAGYQIERNDRDFEFKGFERSTIDKFSNRTQQINAKADELGLTYEEDKAQLGAKTRANKRTGYDKEEIRQQWRSRLTDKELDLIDNAKVNPASSDDSENSERGHASEKKKEDITPEQGLNYALNHILERKSVTSEKELMTIALKRGIGSYTPEAMQKAIKSKEGLLSKKVTNSKDILHTTKEALAEEKNLINTSRKGKGLFEAIHNDYQIKNKQLTQEQANAVKHVLLSKDLITVVTGGAGTGKTWSIKEVAEGIKEKKMAFGAFAPSSAASRDVQRGDGFQNATTIADLLQNKKIQESVRGGMIWLDEAGMVGNQTMNKVIEIAKAQNARILLTGDIKQHGAVERGDALRTIQKYGGIRPAVISKIQRQKNSDYRSAVKSIADGKLDIAFSQLDKMGAIKEADSFEETKQKVALEYVSAIKQKEQTLVVATTHAQGKAVTGAIREKLKEGGMLKGNERVFKTHKNLSFTEAQKQDIASYQEGMVVQFHQNVKGGIKRGTKYHVLDKDENGAVRIALEKKKDGLKLPLHESSKFSVYQTEETAVAKGDKIRITQNGTSLNDKRLNNGNTMTVEGFDKAGNILATSGKRKIALDKKYGNFTHGYYTTSPASQGKSVNRVIVLQSSMSGKATNKEQFYVSASRGKFAISIHTDDKQELIRSVRRSSQRMTATEVAVNGAKQQRGHIGKLKKMAQIFRAGLSRVEKTKEAWQNRKNTMINIITKPIQTVRHAPTRGR
jgi:conjugative relaxase-like TrwC/TraI family protein